MANKKPPKINAQGLSRKEPGLMRTLVADPGKVYISCDLSAGEPSVSAHYTQDMVYRYATFDGVGKAPWYSKTGILMIDDIYLQGMSISPFGKHKIRQEFISYRSPEGLDFKDQWLKDPEVIKKRLKTERQLHKTLILAMGYGAGPEKIQKTAVENDHDISFIEAQTLHQSYWGLYNKIRDFADNLSKQVKERGCIYNDFGFRLTPKPHNSYNAFIQSSVSGVINMLAAFVQEIAPYAEFTTIIHDELIYQVDENKVDLFRKHFQEATDRLNAELDWSIPIRTGFVAGKDFYEAK